MVNVGNDGDVANLLGQESKPLSHSRAPAFLSRSTPLQPDLVWNGLVEAEGILEAHWPERAALTGC
jgi:hypothetical protein